MTSEIEKIPAPPGYEFLEVLGQGAMGVVYKAHQKNVDRLVAIKISKGESEELGAINTKRLLAEARTIARIDHPNIVRVHECFVQDNYVLIVMEFLEGMTFSEILSGKKGRALAPEFLSTIAAQGRMDPGWTAFLSAQVAEALGCAHSLSIYHRDIKPSNLYLTPKGRVVVFDFSIARDDRSTRNTHTGTGLVIGTPNYMSPEQIRGQKIDGRSDIYALGSVMFHCLSGSAPFDDPSDLMICIKHLQEPVPNISEISPLLSPAFAQIITKALDKEPEKRFQTTAELHDALVRTPEHRNFVTAHRELVRQGRTMSPLAHPLPGEDSSDQVPSATGTMMLPEDEVDKAVAGPAPQPQPTMAVAQSRVAPPAPVAPAPAAKPAVRELPRRKRSALKVLLITLLLMGLALAGGGFYVYMYRPALTRQIVAMVEEQTGYELPIVLPPVKAPVVPKPTPDGQTDQQPTLTEQPQTNPAPMATQQEPTPATPQPTQAPLPTPQPSPTQAPKPLRDPVEHFQALARSARQSATRLMNEEITGYRNAFAIGPLTRLGRVIADHPVDNPGDASGDWRGFQALAFANRDIDVAPNLDVKFGIQPQDGYLFLELSNPLDMPVDVSVFPIAAGLDEVGIDFKDPTWPVTHQASTPVRLMAAGRGTQSDATPILIAPGAAEQLLIGSFPSLTGDDSGKSATLRAGAVLSDLRMTATLSPEVDVLTEPIVSANALPEENPFYYPPNILAASPLRAAVEQGGESAWNELLAKTLLPRLNVKAASDLIPQKLLDVPSRESAVADFVTFFDAAWTSWNEGRILPIGVIQQEGDPEVDFVGKVSVPFKVTARTRGEVGVWCYILDGYQRVTLTDGNSDRVGMDRSLNGMLINASASVDPINNQVLLRTSGVLKSGAPAGWRFQRNEKIEIRRALVFAARSDAGPGAVRGNSADEPASSPTRHLWKVVTIYE